MDSYKIILFYKLLNVIEPEQLMSFQKSLCNRLGLKGRVLISSEGINATLEGCTIDIYKYIETMKNIKDFNDIVFKISEGTGMAFPKLSIKLRKEVVTLSSPIEYKPWEETAEFLSSEELHSWFRSKKKFYILDLRNNYENEIGHFENSFWFKEMNNFRDLPRLLPQIEHLKNQVVVTVCTGGIRCEKGTGLLMKSGFKKLYQLKDGIVSYMEKYPNQDFLGKLYVFDGRLMIGFDTESKKHRIVGKCRLCKVSCENVVNYIDHDQGRIQGVLCDNCIVEKQIQLD